MRITLKQDTFNTWSGNDDELDATNGLQIELDSDGRVILLEVERCGTYREMAISLDALLPALQALASKRDEGGVDYDTCVRCTDPTSGRYADNGAPICEACVDAYCEE